MNRLDIFYQNLYELLERLSDELGNYYEEHDDVESSDIKAKLFADFTAEVESLKIEINTLKLSSSLPGSLEIVDKFLEVYGKFILTFGDFSILVFQSLSIWSLIAKRFITILTTELTEDFDIDYEIILGDFKIIDLEGHLIENNFLSYDSSDFNSSIIVFSNDSDKLEKFLNDNIHSDHYDLLLVWLNFINLTIDVPNQFVLLNKPDIQLSDLKAVLKLLVLVNGHTIKTLQKYEVPPFLPHYNKFDFTKKYIQFENISYILNEYNNHDFSLDKYLKLYHTIENFMYKIKVCELQASKGAKPFTINDFQTLYDSFKTNEKIAITYFFTEVGKIDYNGTVNFLNFWKAEWAKLEVLDPTMPVKINLFFKSLGLNYIYNNLKTNLDGNMLGMIVYKIRNSIVHNKDSELHLESVNLPEAAKFIIEDFLIPNLERISFHLIINQNTLIWYSSDTLLLYDS